jgi:hypothetical protein
MKLPTDPFVLHLLVATPIAALMLLAGIFVPLDHWYALGRALGTIASNPAGAVAFITAIGGALVTVRGMWMRPPSAGVLVLVLALAAASSGCGTMSAYRDFSVASTIAHVAVDGVKLAVSEAKAACTTDECRTEATVAQAAVDGLDAMQESLDTAVAAARATPGGEAAAVLSALGASLGRWVQAWNALATALAPLGIVLPQLPPEIASLVTGITTAVAGAVS